MMKVDKLLFLKKAPETEYFDDLDYDLVNAKEIFNIDHIINEYNL